MARTLSAPDGDINFKIIDGREALEQRILIRFRFWLAESFVDSSKGIDYQNNILGFQFDPGLRQNIIRREALSFDEVNEASIPIFTQDDDRRATFSIDLTTIYGPMQIQNIEVSPDPPRLTNRTPSEVSMLSATAQSSSSIALSWNSPLETGGFPILSYEIEESTDSFNFVNVGSVATIITSFTRTGLAGNTLFYYRVGARNILGIGDYSNVASATTSVSANLPPVARAGSDQTGIAAGSTFILDGTASDDPDGSIASQQWTQTAGDTVALVDATALMTTGVAPSTVSDQTLTYSLIVTDNDGQDSVADIVNLEILAVVVPNQPPVARAGSDQTGIVAGMTVTLDGSASSDPDGTIAVFAWTQTAGTTVILSDPAVAQPTYTAPSETSPQTLTFQLLVTDDQGAVSPASTVDHGILAVSTQTSYRFDTIENLRIFATFEEGSDDGQWEIIASGNTASANTGPGTNSGGPYAATDASGGSFSDIQENSTFDLNVESSWPSQTNRVLRIRCAVIGLYNDNVAEGLMVQGRVTGGSWQDIGLIRGWVYSDGYSENDQITDYGGIVRTCSQDGGWLDFDISIQDQYQQIRLRLVAIGGSEFSHDVALWSAELINT